jgi:hypothetical protein
MKLWVDDTRPMPEDFDVHVKSAQAAIELLSRTSISEVSLDHDLGDEDFSGSGYQIACWIEYAAKEKKLNRIKWNIHSANPVGRMKMRVALDNADNHWEVHERSSLQRWKKK